MTRQSLATASLILLFALAYLLANNWASFILLISNTQQNFHQLLTEHIGHFNEKPTRSGLLLILASIAYGVFHAAGPGHGKAVLVTYLSTQKETLKQSLLISFCAAIFQALMAIVIVSVISIALEQTFSQANIVSLRAEQSSYILVMLFGVYLLLRAGLTLKKALFSTRAHAVKNQPHEHSHDHDHQDDCCHHTYVAKESISFWQTLGIIASMGARPCTGAIMVLIYANLVGIYWVGIVATFLMGVGTGLTVAALGWMTLFFKARISHLVAGTAHAQLHQNQHATNFGGFVLSSAGGLILFAIGWSLLQNSLAPTLQHPLF